MAPLQRCPEGVVSMDETPRTLGDLSPLELVELSLSEASRIMRTLRGGDAITDAQELGAIYAYLHLAKSLLKQQD
jgi:hypothetical protein